MVKPECRSHELPVEDSSLDERSVPRRYRGTLYLGFTKWYGIKDFP